VLKVIQELKGLKEILVTVVQQEQLELKVI
jgi:hypothetical protein